MSCTRRFILWLEPSRGRGQRDMIALFCLVQGVTRVLGYSGLAQPVNILPSLLYGWLMCGAFLALIITGAWCKRSSYAGRLAAVYAGALWLLLALDVIDNGAWASFGGALILALASGNEARYRDC